MNTVNISTVSSYEKKYNNIANFLINRIYLIDVIKKPNEIIFTIEDHYKNFEIVLDSISLKCSCDNFKHKIYVCKHIKFIIEKMDQINTKKSKSYNELISLNKLFYVEIKKNLNTFDLSKFNSDINPRYKEYKLLEDTDYNGKCYNEKCYNGKCYICLEKLNKKIIRCKHCNKYYHENCIYMWLRCGPACNCPNCREQWI